MHFARPAVTDSSLAARRRGEAPHDVFFPTKHANHHHDDLLLLLMLRVAFFFIPGASGAEQGAGGGQRPPDEGLRGADVVHRTLPGRESDSSQSLRGVFLGGAPPASRR